MPRKSLGHLDRLSAFMEANWETTFQEALRLGGEPEFEVRINSPDEPSVASLLAWLKEHGTEDPSMCIMEEAPLRSVKTSSGTTFRSKGSSWEAKTGVVKWFPDYRISASVEHACEAPVSFRGMVTRKRSRRAFVLESTNSSVTPDGRAVVRVAVTRVEMRRRDAKKREILTRSTEVEVELSNEVRCMDFAVVAMANVLEAVLKAMKGMG